MRLTLRTMLAYMDGILEPEDAEDIRGKIEESESATKIYHRIRDVIRRLRLAAPGLTERGPGLDANTVAEYLDNTLPADRVPDFEKVCLESDIHLAEVASCHQILTLVLGEAAEIDPASRDRMYQLASGAGAAEAESDVTPPPLGDGTAADRSPSPGIRPKPTVPAYLREPAKKDRVLPLATVLLLAGCFLGIVLLALGQFEPGTPLGDLLRPSPRVAEQLPEAKPQEGAAAKTVAAKPEAKTASEPEKAKSTTPATSPAKDNPPEPVSPANPLPPLKPSPEPAGNPESPPADGKLPPPAGEQPSPKPPGEQVAGIEPKLPAVPAAKSPLDKPPPEGGMPPAGVEQPKAEPAPASAQRMGRFISDSMEILLQYDPASAIWWRVPAEAFLFAGERLLALPTYRPRIALTPGGATVDLLGGTRVSLLAEGSEGPAGVKIAFGRVVLRPLAEPGTRVRIAIAGRTWTLTLVDAEAVAALEAAPMHVPGTNPETVPAEMAIDLYVSHGEILWDEGGGSKPVRLTSPAHLVVAAPSALAPRAAPGAEKSDQPKWIVAEPLGPLDRRTANTLAQSVTADRSAGLGLMEMTDYRQKEVRWLAARCLTYLGQFEPMIAALNDPNRRTEWPDYVEQLRLGIARGAETSAAIHQAIEKQFDQEAPAFYRMLWGYSDKDLQNGKDADLVKDLEHEALAFRVLAFWNLKDITGLGLLYRPEYTAAKRQQSLRAWKQRQQAHEIRIKTEEEKAHTPKEPLAPPVEKPEPPPSEKPEPFPPDNLERPPQPEL